MQVVTVTRKVYSNFVYSATQEIPIQLNCAFVVLCYSVYSFFRVCGRVGHVYVCVCVGVGVCVCFCVCLYVFCVCLYVFGCVCVCATSIHVFRFIK